MKSDVGVAVAEHPSEGLPLFQRLRSLESSREIVLTICFVLILFLFAITALVSRLYHKKVHSLGDEWFSKGEAALRAGQVKAALDDYRNALVYSPNNSVFQLHLAQALAAAGRLDEAASYLTNLLAESPGNGELNLELARIAVRKNQIVDAMRYYQSAIYGVWESDPLVRRWNVRRELVEYLLGHGDVNDAQPEAIALAQEVPAGDLDRQRTAGEFLLRAGLWDRAREEFQSVLKFDSRDAEALAGAGTALYQVQRYPEALLYFNRLPHEKRVEPQIANMIENARAIVSANPWAAGLSAEERARRTSDALMAAVARMSDCAHEHGESLSETPAVSDFQNFYATSQDMARDWSERNLTLHPDRIDAAMALVFQIEDATAQRCGEPTSGIDNALRVIEQLREKALS
ncbi:MAG TPA: tetratricopeptide repeat protein [Candidatus Acidoferrales bacterium]|nr:tetratricopeptide repeat protein [Candidatus Acidoferrales bacterium]